MSRYLYHSEMSERLMIEVIDLQSSFVRAAYGQVPSALLRYTAEIQGAVLHVQAVVFDNISEEHLDEVREIIGYINGDFSDLTEGSTLFVFHPLKKPYQLILLP